MRFVFIDESGDKKFKDYLGLSIATINSYSYALLKRESVKILKSIGWESDTEFKGSFLFSQTKGCTAVEVEKRVVAAGKLLDLNASTSRSRMQFAYGRMKSDNQGADYLAALPSLLDKFLPRAEKGAAGKNLITVICDDRDDVDMVELHKAIQPVLEAKKYCIFEQVSQATSTFDTVGLMYADLIGYLLARVDTISQDQELFEGLDRTKLMTNGKIRKLLSSNELLKKIKKLEVYEKS